jgi:phenylpyruvate tautomerase PptA (4-oxalocrotonate tautomerase family)
MPVIDIEMVIYPGERLPAGLAQTLADSLGEVLASRASGTWVRLKEIAADHYAENGGLMEEGIQPVFVSVLKARLSAWPERQKEAWAIAAAVAQACGRPPENVHVLYLPEAAGRMAFGGNLIPE